MRLIMTSGPQGGRLGIQIWAAMKDAGFKIGEPEFTPLLLYEVSIGGPPERSDAVNCIAYALGNKLPIMGVTRVLPAGASILITVGEKELGQLPE